MQTFPRHPVPFLGLALVLFFGQLLVPSQSSLAESILAPLPGADVIRRYEIPFEQLSTRERWQTRIHGLRFAPLDPRIWAPFRYDRTDNRTLIPIKRYVLRASEEPGFVLRSIEVRFRFRPSGRAAMEKRSHQHDPVFDISIGGRMAGTSPPDEQFSVVRLSAFPSIPSGVYRETARRFRLREGGALPLLETGRIYLVRIECVGELTTVLLDGHPVSSVREPGLCAGLLSLQTSWHPVLVESLRIDAKTARTASWQELPSGLVPVGADGGRL